MNGGRSGKRFEAQVAHGSDPIREGILFLAAGGLNTCFGYACFATFLWLTGSRELAVLCGTAAGVAFNFSTYGAVFSKSGTKRLPHFLAFYLVMLSANMLLLTLLAHAGLDPFLGQAIILLLSTPVSYCAMRNLVFPREKLS